jgi:hypothetical protein
MTSMSKAEAKRIRVGIIGASPDRGWATQAHIPALKSPSDDFEITALCERKPMTADDQVCVTGLLEDGVRRRERSMSCRAQLTGQAQDAAGFR